MRRRSTAPAWTLPAPAGRPVVVDTLAPVLNHYALSSLRRFYEPTGAASSFRIHLDTACTEPHDWHSAWDAVPSSWRGVADQDRWWWSSKYGAQGFVPRMIEQSPFFTTDWRVANASIVVLMVLHLSGAAALTQQRCLQRLRERSEAWQRTGGAAHFFVLTNDRGPCCINGVYKDVGFLRHHIIGNGELPLEDTPRGRPLQHFPSLGATEWAPSIPCFEAHKDISIPTPNLHWPRVPAAAPLSPMRPRRRRPYRYLLFHAGTNKFSNCRKQLLRLHADDPESLVRAQLNASEYVRAMREAKFCVVCGGFAPFTPRLAEALHFECVPILVREFWLPPFAELLNYSTFSLSVRLADVARLKRIARAADHPQLLAGVRRARVAFEYHLERYTGRDMLPLLVHAMHERRRTRLGVPSGPRAAWASVEPLSNSVVAHGRYTTRWAVPELEGNSTPRWRRPVLWQRVGRFIQNLSYNRPGGDATFRHAGEGWRCRTAPINYDARECVCKREKL